MRPRRRRRREERDPWTREARDPLEVLARLVGRCAHPMGGDGRGGVGLSDADLTSALGYMPDKLGSALAMSVAGRHGAMLGYIARRAWKRVLRSIREARALPVNLHEPRDRFRTRIVLADAMEALIWPERRRGMVSAAKAAKMRVASYATLYRHIDGKLQEELADARREFRLRLWSDDLLARAESLACRRQVALPGHVGLLLLRTDAEPWQPMGFRVETSIDALVESLRTRGLHPALALVADALADIGAVSPKKRRTTTVDADGTQVTAIVMGW